MLAVIAPEGAAVSAPEAPAPEPATAEAAEEVAAVSSSEGDAPRLRLPRRPSRARAAAPESGNGNTFVSPVVARIASEHGVDPTAVPGTGTGGRVTKKDILAFVEGGGQAATPQAAEPEPVAAPEPTPVAAAPAPPPVQAPPPEPPPAPPAPPPVPRRLPHPWRHSLLRRRPPLPLGARRRNPGAAGRDLRADDRDAEGHRGAHAPLARHLRARHERDRGRHVKSRRDPRAS